MPFLLFCHVELFMGKCIESTMNVNDYVFSLCSLYNVFKSFGHFYDDYSNSQKLLIFDFF